MDSYIPLRPTGFTSEALFDQAQWDKNYGPGSGFINSSSVRISRTSRGTAFHVKRQPVANSGAQIQQFTLVTMAGDYMVCAPIGGGANVNIAKNPKLRNSITTETIYGVVFNYAYAAYNGTQFQYVARDATGGATESQVVTPAYIIGDVLTAANIVGGTPVMVAGNALTLMDLNCDGRAWTKKAGT